MKNVNLDAVEEAKEYKNVPAGGYVAIITAVEDVTSKEYLKLELDIVEGEFKGRFSELYKAKGFWGLDAIRSYKESALGFFKQFTSSVEKSNPGYKFDYDETKLKAKRVGIVLGEEEYQKKKDNTIGTRLKIQKFASVDDIHSGNFKVPEKKMLAKTTTAATSFAPVEGDDSDLPF